MSQTEAALVPRNLLQKVENVFDKTPDTTSKYAISDALFIRKLDNLRSLCDFIERECKIDDEKSKLLKLGVMARLRYGLDGREATEEEWAFVENASRELLIALSEPHRRAFYVRKSEYLLTWLPFAF